MGKKTPASNTCKKVTASARAKISTKTVRKVASQVNGSYIQDSNGVSTVVNLSEPMASSSSSTSNADILQYLQKTDASTQALAHRVEHIEHSANSTPIQNRQRSHFPESSSEGFLQAGVRVLTQVRLCGSKKRFLHVIQYRVVFKGWHLAGVTDRIRFLLRVLQVCQPIHVYFLRWVLLMTGTQFYLTLM